MPELSTQRVTEKAESLVKYYTNDLEDDLIQECIFSHICSDKTAECAVKPGSNSLLSLSTFLRNQSLSNVYPNLDIALGIALSTTATNCSGERSFSCLKRVKNYQRSSLSQEKMNSLALLYIEAEIMNTINYDAEKEMFWPEWPAPQPSGIGLDTRYLANPLPREPIPSPHSKNERGRRPFRLLYLFLIFLHCQLHVCIS
ncbi:unnamed protein product [Psylliodes chrysocephalus]|uniref:HAT C-terminal dimerisation domain-containing protein n=1 Tax=Psylliodes chrysocephalus TaxID=3402493 RepID=A0A9P0CSA7_9CUCU|nr:unnamed protein product [Psylliodes chrysocephala]